MKGGQGSNGGASVVSPPSPRSRRRLRLSLSYRRAVAGAAGALKQQQATNKDKEVRSGRTAKSQNSVACTACPNHTRSEESPAATSRGEGRTQPQEGTHSKRVVDPTTQRQRHAGIVRLFSKSPVLQDPHVVDLTLDSDGSDSSGGDPAGGGDATCAAAPLAVSRIDTPVDPDARRPQTASHSVCVRTTDTTAGQPGFTPSSRSSTRAQSRAHTLPARVPVLVASGSLPARASSSVAVASVSTRAALFWNPGTATKRRLREASPHARLQPRHQRVLAKKQKSGDKRKRKKMKKQKKMNSESPRDRIRRYSKAAGGGTPVDTVPPAHASVPPAAGNITAFFSPTLRRTHSSPAKIVVPKVHTHPVPHPTSCCAPSSSATGSADSLPPRHGIRTTHPVERAPQDETHPEQAASQPAQPDDLLLSQDAVAVDSVLSRVPGQSAYLTHLQYVLRESTLRRDDLRRLLKVGDTVLWLWCAGCVRLCESRFTCSLCMVCIVMHSRMKSSWWSGSFPCHNLHKHSTRGCLRAAVCCRHGTHAMCWGQCHLHLTSTHVPFAVFARPMVSHHLLPSLPGTWPSSNRKRGNRQALSCCETEARLRLLGRTNSHPDRATTRFSHARRRHHHAMVEGCCSAVSTARQRAGGCSRTHAAWFLATLPCLPHRSQRHRDAVCGTGCGCPRPLPGVWHQRLGRLCVSVPAGTRSESGVGGAGGGVCWCGWLGHHNRKLCATHCLRCCG